MFHAYILFLESGARAGFGHSPDFDWAYANTQAPADLAVITPPVPVAFASLVAHEVDRRLAAAGRVRAGRARQPAVRVGLRTARSVLHALGLPGPAFLSPGPIWQAPRADTELVGNRIPPRSLVVESALALSGRSLLYEEAMRALASGGFSSLDKAHDLLAAMCAEGLGLLVPAVSISSLGREPATGADQVVRSRRRPVPIVAGARVRSACNAGRWGPHANAFRCTSLRPTTAQSYTPGQ